MCSNVCHLTEPSPSPSCSHHLYLSSSSSSLSCQRTSAEATCDLAVLTHCFIFSFFTLAASFFSFFPFVDGLLFFARGTSLSSSLLTSFFTFFFEAVAGVELSLFLGLTTGAFFAFAKGFSSSLDSSLLGGFRAAFLGLPFDRDARFFVARGFSSSEEDKSESEASLYCLPLETRRLEPFVAGLAYRNQT